MKKLNILLILLSLGGFLISLYLSYQYSRPLPLECGVGNDSCELVRTSAYAEVLGIKLPFLGAAYFFVISVVLFLVTLKKEDKILNEKYLIFPFVAAVLYESYLTYVQFFKINALCFWCIIIEIIVVLTLIIYLYKKKIEMKTKRQPIE